MAKAKKAAEAAPKQVDPPRAPAKKVAITADMERAVRRGNLQAFRRLVEEA